MFARLRSLFSRPPAPVVAPTASGFEVRHARNHGVSVEWEQVRRIAAYKRDLLTTDCIVLAFETDTSAGVLEVSEQWPGFSHLFAAMEAALGISPQWYLQIMTPAFEATPQLLYQRSVAGEAPKSD